MRAITDDMIHMLLERLSKRNITIWTEAGKIKYKAPAGALTSEELQCIKENKEKIIKYLENHAIWSKGVKEMFPLTSIQKAYLIGSDQAYELGGINAHYYMELNCCDIDVVRFERAVNEVIARTDAMRTIVLSNGMQAVLEKVPTYKIERFEFGNEKDREEKREQWSHCVFDLCKWPLYNIRISYVNKAFPRIHIDFDCIIMDAWSAKMMIAKIFEVYEGKIVKWGTYSFKQYCLEQKEYRETHPENAAYSYWRKRVTELPPAPDLPYKKKLSELCGHRFDRISQKFSREETSALVFEIDKKIYYGLERKYTAKSVEFNIQTDRGNLSLRGYLGPIIWEGFFPEISNNENSKGYLFHPTIQTVDGEANYDCYINTVYSNSLASEIKKTERYIKRQENVASKMQQQILNIRCSQELLSKLNFSLKCKKEYHPLLLEELLDLRTESEIENIFDNFSQEYIQYSVEMRKKYWHKQYYSI